MKRRFAIWMIVVLVLLGTGMPARVSAQSDATKALIKRHMTLYDSDSVEEFLKVTAEMKQALEEEGLTEKLYNSWYNEVMYTLIHLGGNKALMKAEEMKAYAREHESKYGYYMSSIVHAFIAYELGLNDRAEKLLRETIEYKDRNLPNRKPDVQIYGLYADLCEDKEEWEESIRSVEEALTHDYWDDDDRVALHTLRCHSALMMEPKDSARIQKYYDELHRIIDETGYNDNFNEYVECRYALYKHQFGKALEVARTILDRETRLPYVVEALEGFGRYKEALDSFKAYKEWSDQIRNAETLDKAEKNILELQASRAKNEATTMRLTQQRTVLAAIVCSLLLAALFLVIDLRRRHQQMRKLKQAYDQLEEVTTQKERIESELRIARDIQMSMVPGVFPEHERLDMYAYMSPAKEVGGDLYSYVMQGDSLYFCVGDVSGKGVPASLFMAQSARLFHTLAAEGMTPDGIMNRMNRELAAGNKKRMFVTMFIGQLNLNDGHLDYCNAGHNQPVIGIGENQGEFLEMKANLPLAVRPGFVYKGETLDNIKGRALFVYSDGLNEAENRRHEQLGNDRMLELLRQKPFDNSRHLIERMADEVEKFRDGAEPNDDLTLMCLKLI